jgi:3',5'-cyclic AMP phosphodiesterase CpdA
VGGETVATLLHLSDLHLGDGAADEALGDHKIEVIARSFRQKRSTALAATLGALGDALQREGRILDAVVVSGDVTYQGDPKGFEKLPDALAPLGRALPDPSRIMVVPGNHDVTWGTPPSSAQRYQAFVDGVRQHGYVTPYLDGVDIGANNVSAYAASPVLTAGDYSFIIVALNSANHCGVRADDPGLRSHLDALAALAETDAHVAALLRAWRANSLYDIARLDDLQRQYARRALESALTKLDHPDRPVRIAVMHHQLLPITLDEEIKPFEALTNLAQVRDWLALNRFDLVLHGHKHVAALYEDRYVPLGAPPSVQLWRRVIVSAVGTVGLGQASNNTIARLIEVDSKLPTLGRVRATAIAAQQPGVPLPLADLAAETHLTHASGPANPGVIEGTSPRDVHEQLLAMFDASESREPTPPVPTPLICRVADGAGAKAMPSSYETLGSLPPDIGWFADLVRLWQAKNRLSAMQFNHGERIFNMRGINQFSRAIECLRARDQTSRAVITLINQERDKTADINVEFPAFCLIQLFIEGNRLCIMGYFRKQEMRYWWAINTAELAELQQLALTALNTHRGNAPLEAGDIITVTALPTAGASVPRVMVPRVDRWVDDDADRLLRMALVTFDPLLPTAAGAASDWRLTLDECRPGQQGGAADGNPVPVSGLETIARHLRSLTLAFGDNDRANALLAALDQCIAGNRSYLMEVRGAGSGLVDKDQAAIACDNLGRAVTPILEAVSDAPKPLASQDEAPTKPTSA